MTPQTVAHRASLSMEFSWQEYWSGLPFPSPEELPNSGIESWSPASQADSLLLELQRRLQEVTAAAAAKSHQSCPTLCDLRDGSPPGSAIPGILQARILEWKKKKKKNTGVGCHFLLHIWLIYLAKWSLESSILLQMAGLS